MMQEKDLQELAELVSDKGAVLSLYLDADPQRRSTDQYKLALRQLLTQASNQGAVPADIERVERFFEHEYNWQGKAVACFSSHTERFWRAFPLPVAVGDFVFVGRRPYLKPLTDLWDEYGRLGVVTVDREGARAFIYHLGALESSDGLLGTEVKRHKQGGWAATRLQRHEDEEARHNLKDAAEWADTYLRQHNVTRVILSGTDGNVAQFRDLLPRTLQDKVIGQISLDMNASPVEVWERAIEVARQAEKRAESDLLDQVITLAHKGGAGVTGLSDTLVALQEGRVYHLLVSKGYHSAGYLCESCGAAVIEQSSGCPYCNGELTPTSDVVNVIIQRLVGAGLKVSFIDHEPRLSEAGGIAALLRY